MPDAVIIDALRTPIGRYGGVLSTVRPDDLAAHVVKAAVERNGLDPPSVDEVYMGCTNQAGEDNRNVARMAGLLAGLPVEVPAVTVNRLCASGLEAAVQGARQLRLGDAGLVLAGGVESMSRAPLVTLKPERGFPRGNTELVDTTIGWRFVNPRMQERHSTESMGETAENVAERFCVTREAQDVFACRSQEKAAAARSRGRFEREIVAIEVPQRRGELKVVDTDEFIRPNTTLEALAKLKPVFRSGGSVTAGNSSGINDGASALLVASEDAVRRYNLKPLARVVSSVVAGVEPRVMGLGPVPSSLKALEQAGIALDDVDVLEINEAFAAQVLGCLRELGLPADESRLNLNGGAIALGHPLGMSGARLILTAAHELQETGGRYALATMCVGVGQGMATVLEKA
jgi:acetyl-CoA acyltransferase